MAQYNLKVSHSCCVLLYFLQTVFNAYFLCMCITFLPTKFQIPVSNISLATSVKPKATENVPTALCSLVILRSKK
jgi:hypothetical protein